MVSVESTFFSTIKEHKMDELIAARGNVIVAFSGGADSACLLHLFKKYCDEYNFSLAAAHVNHQIRGNDADSDEKFCRKIAGELGIKLFVRSVDVPKLAQERGLGLEETARNVRYEFFEELAKTENAVIATAHSASDSLETVIFNMMRGCGTHGLCGILPIRDGLYIRPLIGLSGEEIRNYCAEYKIGYVIDKTNSDTDYTRNYIRHVVAPTLKKLSNNPERAAAKMTSLVRRDDDFLSECAARLINNGQENAFLDRHELVSIHEAVSSRAVLMLYNLTKNTSSTIEERHIDEIIRLSREKNGECYVSLPGKMTAVISRDRVYFSSQNKTNTNHDGIVFKYPDDGDFFENQLYRVEFSLNEHKNHKTSYNNKENIYKLSILRTFSFDKIKGQLFIRYRADGDTFTYGGIKRRVKKLFIDKKLSSFEKSETPLICDGEGIVFIPGFPMRDDIISEKCQDNSENTPTDDKLTVRIYKKITDCGG